VRRVSCPICDGDGPECCDNCGGVGTVETTPVVFRSYSDGDVVALFPTILADPDGRCSSYMHIGQHGAADYWHVVATTHPAAPDECQDLLVELGRIGYALRPVLRASGRMHDDRRAQLWRGPSAHAPAGGRT
jgi:hypothetical protein